MLRLTKYISQKARTNRVFIVPTLLGLKLLIVNIILLSMGLIYANNYLLLFNFIFFCLFLISMFYTHFNLHGIVLESIECSDGFAKENINLSFKFKVPSKQIYPAISINLKSNNSWIPIKAFSINENGGSDIQQIVFSKRGVFTIDRVELQTLFPLNLFRAFSYFNTTLNVVVYPEIFNYQKTGEDTLTDKNQDDFYFNIRSYLFGDRINRIAWKKSREGDLKTKYEEFDNGNAVMFSIDIKDKANTEKELSIIASSIRRCQEENIIFGIKSPKGNIAAAPPTIQHFKNSLRFLAEYDA